MTKEQETATERRDFLKKAILGTGAVLCGGTVMAIMQACESDTLKSGDERPFTFSLSETPELATVGNAVYKSVGTFNNGMDVILIRNSESEFLAVTSVCTHEGCTVGLPTEVGAATMRCPCHGATFSTADGAWVQSPQPAPRLPRFRTEYNAAANELTIFF